MSPPTPTPDPSSDYKLGRVEATLMRMGTIGELMALLMRGGRWWMLPLVLILVTLGLGLVIVESIPYVAPFIYMAL